MPSLLVPTEGSGGWAGQTRFYRLDSFRLTGAPSAGDFFDRT
ncbi:MAG: hypothetical protein ACM3X9_00965 [Bacillota bacterium]